MPLNLSHLKKFDWLLFGASVLLAAFGLAAIYSTSLGGGDAPGDFTAFWRQLVFAAAGVVLVLAVAALDYRILAGLARVLYAASIVLLGAVLLFGQTIRGSRSWFGIGGLGIQPVEIVKFFLVIFLAKFLSDYARHHVGLKRIISSGAALAGVLLLVLLQPDFGSALLLLAMWGVMLLVSGIRRSHLAVICLLCVATAIFSWAFVLKPYQKDRIAVFWDPAKDPVGRGYNVTQSIIAIGSGGITGRGLGFGPQSQLRFLPERQTDFIFAAVAEELGFLGVTLVLAFFSVIFYRGYRLATEARDDFTMFLVLGVMAFVAVEMIVNIGGNLRLLPVTGVTLPFLSYGGSSLLVKFLMIGVLESVAVRR